MIPEELDCEARKAINELQMLIKMDLPPKLSEDSTLFYRFLKARDYDVEKAEKMLRKHISWRKAQQVDTILDDFKPKKFYSKYIQPSVIGFDKDSEAVIYLPIGKIETTDILKCIKMNDGERHFIWFFEKLRAFIEETNKEKKQNATQVTTILDLDKLTLSNTTSKASIEGLLVLVHMAQDNYPELMKSIYLINSPNFFVLAFSILKTVMSSSMIQKFKFFAHNGWQNLLLEKIDADVLPAFLGGKRTDPDGNPLCKTFISHAGKTSPDEYLSNEDRYFKSDAQVQKIIVPQLGKKEICIDITETGSVISWRFLVRSKDIGFGLSFKTSVQEMKELLPIERYRTSDGTEEGSYKPKSIGKYIIIFDNSYSWVNSKEIQYCITVEKI